VLCSLAIWLEVSLEKNPVALNSPYVFCFSDDVEVPSGGLKSKQMVQKFVKDILNGGDFVPSEKVEEGAMLLGSHSVRKFAATHVRRSGITRDEKDIRGRWKGKGRVSDVYDDVELPYPDAKVAEKLCNGGACFYVCRDGLDEAMMNEFILSQVVPSIRKRLPDSACLVLGKALLWLIYSSVAHDYIPIDMIERVKSEWDQLGRDGDFVGSPVDQRMVVVTGDHGEVCIDLIDTEFRINEDRDGGVALGGGAIRNQLLGLRSSMMSIRQENLELKTTTTALKLELQRSLLLKLGWFD